MTGFNYAKTRATAERLIAKFGQAAFLVRSTNSGTAYNPTVITVTSSVMATVMDYNNLEIDGTLIKRGDKRVYLSTENVSISPTLADRLRIGGLDHSIVSFKALAPAGVIVFWEVQARK